MGPRRAVAAACALAVVLAAGPAGAGTGGGAADTARILMLGDSNLVLNQDRVGAAFLAEGYQAELVAAFGYGLFNLDDYWLPVLPARLTAVDPELVVVALGANDTKAASATRAFPDRLDRMMEALGDRTVIWLTHNADRPPPVDRRARRINTAIRRATKRWPNLVVLDLAPALAANPSLLFDRVHLTTVGQQVLAEELVAAALFVASDPTGVDVIRARVPLALLPLPTTTAPDPVP